MPTITIPTSYNPSGRNILTAGEYKATIMSATLKQSKTGKTMYEISLQPEGQTFSVFDYIIADDAYIAKDNRNAKRIVDFLLATKAFEALAPGASVELPDGSTLVGKEVYIVVTVENDAAYGTSNKVKSYSDHATIPGGNADQVPY